MDIEEWKKKNSGVKSYAHFDKRVSIDQVWDYITSTQKVSKHSFYPFIHYQKRFIKYSKQSGVKPKERELCYSAHIDRCIYQYYGFILNQLYNERVEKDGFSDSTAAYRDNLKKSSIHFAKRAYDFIRTQEACYVIVGDFTHFFDSLDHKYLKKQLCGLLNCKELPTDYYAVFKNITKYAKWDLNDLLKLNGLADTPEGIKTLNNQAQVLTLSDFKSHKSQFVVSNKESFGIPQGSAISAVLSNVYMLEFDKQIRQYVNTYGGMYMRYSDDFIIALPKNEASDFSVQLSWIQGMIASIKNLKLQPKKHNYFFTMIER